MLAVMRARGSISAEMQLAGGQLAACILTGSLPVLLLLGILGVPAASCLVHVLGRGWPLKQWAQQGWQGQPIAQETASGILVAALAALLRGTPRLLLDEAAGAADHRGLIGVDADEFGGAADDRRLEVQPAGIEQA